MQYSAEDIIGFWFYDVGRDRWFERDDALDAVIRDRFLPLYEQAAAGELQDWRTTPEGMLGLMILLDQFPHRMFRNDARAFATGEMAVELARAAIIRHFDDRIPAEYKLLFYLPFLNSESEGDQRLALYYIRERVKEHRWLDMAEEKFETVLRFGRFPDRNPILGRVPTPEEAEFLARRASA